MRPPKGPRVQVHKCFRAYSSANVRLEVGPMLDASPIGPENSSQGAPEIEANYDACDMFHRSLLVLSSWGHRRHMVEFLRYPWLLCKLIDPRVPATTREFLVELCRLTAGPLKTALSDSLCPRGQACRSGLVQLGRKFCRSFYSAHSSTARGSRTVVLGTSR